MSPNNNPRLERPASLVEGDIVPTLRKRKQLRNSLVGGSNPSGRIGAGNEHDPVKAIAYGVEAVATSLKDDR